MSRSRATNTAVLAWQAAPASAKIALAAGGGLLIFWGVRRLMQAVTDPSDTSITDKWEKGGTLSKKAINSLADQFQAAAWQGSGFEDDPAMAGILMAMNNNSDVQNLINAYGSRKYEGGIGFLWDSLNLVETVTTYLDAKYIDLVNEDYQNKGIEFRFYGS